MDPDGTIKLVAAIVRGTPSLPHAACIGHHAPLRNLAVGALHTAGRTKIASSLRWISRNPARTLDILGQTT